MKCPSCQKEVNPETAFCSVCSHCLDIYKTATRKWFSGSVTLFKKIDTAIQIKEKKK